MLDVEVVILYVWVHRASESELAIECLEGFTVENLSVLPGDPVALCDEFVLRTVKLLTLRITLNVVLDVAHGQVEIVAPVDV